MKSSRISVAALMGAQAQVTFNDCAAKFMLIALAQQLARGHGDDPKPVVSLIAVLLTLPYVLFGPLCGWLSDRFAKRSVINFALGLQLVVIGLLVLAMKLQSFNGALVCFGLLSLQTAVVAPAKRGFLLEYVGEKQLSRMVGYMEMFNVTAILVGSFAGGQLFSHWLAAGDDIWTAGLKVGGLLAGLAVAAAGFFQLAAPTRAQSGEPFRWNLWVRHFTDITEVWRDRPLWRATMGICFFYGVGGYIMLLIPQIAYELQNGGVRTGAVSSNMMLLVGVGTMSGNLLAGLFSRRGVELGLAPIGGAILFGTLAVMGFAPLGGRAFDGLLVLAGFSTGFFLVPLYAFIQQRAGNHRRGRILAGVRLLDSVAGSAASVIYSLLAGD